MKTKTPQTAVNRIRQSLSPHRPRLSNLRSITVRLRLNVNNRIDEILGDLRRLLGSNLLNLLQLFLDLLLGLLLDLRVGSRVLFGALAQASRRAGGSVAATSASNRLNSASFCFLYSSISFCASWRASFTFFVRSVEITSCQS
jgi:hypothetical protein